MNTVQSDHSDPIRLRTPPRSMGAIAIRFFGLLFAAVTLMTLIWSR